MKRLALLLAICITGSLLLTTEALATKPQAWKTSYYRRDARRPLLQVNSRTSVVDSLAKHRGQWIPQRWIKTKSTYRLSVAGASLRLPRRLGLRLNLWLDDQVQKGRATKQTQRLFPPPSR